MRILYFHQHFGTPNGSTGTRSYEIASRLVQKGHSVTMVCGSTAGNGIGNTSAFRKGRRTTDVDGISVIELDLRYSNKDGFLKRTLTFLRYAAKSIIIGIREPADLVFATSTPLTASIPGIAARWLMGREFVFEVRDLWPELPKAMGVIKNPITLFLMSALEWISYHSAHRLVGLSPGIVDGIERRNVPAERIALIPNGCDLNIFQPTKNKWRPSCVQDSDFMAVYTGTHGIANGLSNLVKVGQELKKRNVKEIKLVFVGDGKLKPELQASVERLGLSDIIIFHDPVKKTELAGLISSADLGLMSLANVPAFYFGTSPNKFFDYISGGLPVLVNYPGWMKDLIDEHDCGYSVPPDDPVSYADALCFAAENRSSLATMSDNARKLAADKFSRSELVDRWIEWVLHGKTT